MDYFWILFAFFLDYFCFFFGDFRRYKKENIYEKIKYQYDNLEEDNGVQCTFDNTEEKEEDPLAAHP